MQASLRSRAYLTERKHDANRRTVNGKDNKNHFKKAIYSGLWWKMLVILKQQSLKFWINKKETGCLENENIQVDHEREQNNRIENRKQFALKIKNVQQNKLTETRVNQLNEMGFTYRKDKNKT